MGYVKIGRLPKRRFIQYLAERHQEDELTIKAMKLVLEDFMKNQKSYDEQMALFQAKLSNLENQLSEERKLRKSAERNSVATGLCPSGTVLRLASARLRKKDKSGKPTPAESDRQDEKNDNDF